MTMHLSVIKSTHSWKPYGLIHCCNRDSQKYSGPDPITALCLNQTKSFPTPGPNQKIYLFFVSGISSMRCHIINLSLITLF